MVLMAARLGNVTELHSEEWFKWQRLCHMYSITDKTEFKN
jgi:hypothetical protein